MKKKRILHLFNHYLPQTENWVYNLIVNIPDIEVFIGATYYLKHNFYHLGFTCYEHPFGEMEQQAQRWNKHKPIDFFKKVGFKAVQPFLGDMRSGLYHFAKDKEIDLVHAHFADMGWYFRKIPRKLNVPYVVSFYGWDYSSLPNRFPIYEQRFKKLFSDADMFLCEGEYGAERLQKMGCLFDKIKIQRLGVLSDRIPIFIRKKRKHQLNLVQVATFTEKKGHIYTIKSFEKALKHCPNMHLTLVGGESGLGRKKYIKDLVREKKLMNKITVLDQIDYSRLYEFLADFHVFIHPSCHAGNGDCEGGAPIVLLDAQATGMPIISTNHCDIPSEVQHMKTGILTKEKDAGALADSIKTFYQMTNEDYQIYAKNARRYMEGHYDIRKNAKRLKACYEQLIS